MSTRTNHYDLCVIGGGINGAGIARDAAGRGLSVLLLEANDLGSATSSASTKLIHGGLRYLEHYQFKLVAESLNERERLLRSAPHIIWLLRFVLPHEPTMRPRWLLRLGLLLYDRLAKRSLLPGSKAMKLSRCPEGNPLKESYVYGFSYSDCWVEDSRLVVLNAIDAREQGAIVKPRHACVRLNALRDRTGWQIFDNWGKEYCARAVVNATGPWARQFLEENNLTTAHTPGLKLVRGSHIIVPKHYKGDHTYILQQPDKRIVFAIPYEHHFTLIGTTDQEQEGSPANPEISHEEKNYLINAINRSFKRQISTKDIIRTYSGVRPLLEEDNKNASNTTRDYKLELDVSHGPPLLNIFGGKLTTYRTLAEKAVNKLSETLEVKETPWTKTACLPGGNIPNADFEAFYREMAAQYPDLPPKLRRRLARAYGTRLNTLLKNGLGKLIGDDLFEAEVNYLRHEEWAVTAQDVLWRRSKLGLHVHKDTVVSLEKFMEQQ